MKALRWYFVTACVIAALSIPITSYAFDSQLTRKLIEDATEYGSKHKGKDIFDSPIVKSACFGEYPQGEGGLLLTKYIEVAIISAMSAMKDQPIAAESIQTIEKSKTFKVVVDVSDEDIQDPEDIEIVLQQGTNNILAQTYDFSKELYGVMRDVICTFQYDKIDPKASTTIKIKTQKKEKKYKLDLSRIK